MFKNCKWLKYYYNLYSIQIYTTEQYHRGKKKKKYPKENKNKKEMNEHRKTVSLGTLLKTSR